MPTPPSAPNAGNDLKTRLQVFNLAQQADFAAHRPIHELLHQRAAWMDNELITLWQAVWREHGPVAGGGTTLTLCAVGGYGRRELHPGSDLDLLLLHSAPLTDTEQRLISAFFAALWDSRLVIGHAVRTPEACYALGRDDLTIATNLFEARFLCGDAALFTDLSAQLARADFWPPAQFFAAKLAEQNARHARHAGAQHKLEPDVKNHPGGLRDIQTLQWISQRLHFAASAPSANASALAAKLTAAEQADLTLCQHLLWRVRFALHAACGKSDNRLLLDRQGAVASALGYMATDATYHPHAPIEAMMQAFYQTTRRVSELSALQLQLFSAAFAPPCA
ncbi:MAG: [protein-PII] uridylyltransferase, partial [Aeromonas sp.]